ncbi:hypothetical protein KIPB_015323, partial [Kipferlia bialata]
APLSLSAMPAWLSTAGDRERDTTAQDQTAPMFGEVSSMPSRRFSSDWQYGHGLAQAQTHTQSQGQGQRVSLQAQSQPPRQVGASMAPSVSMGALGDMGIGAISTMGSGQATMERERESPPLFMEAGPYALAPKMPTFGRNAAVVPRQYLDPSTSSVSSECAFGHPFRSVQRRTASGIE